MALATQLLIDLAAQYGTPLYVFDHDQLAQNCRSFTDTLAALYPDSEVVFAAKACATIGLFQVLKELGVGIDAVSLGEMETAFRAGIDSSKMVLHGNNKTDEEIRVAIDRGVRIIIDNEPELDRIAQLATSTAKVLIRVNPEVETRTHKAIQTGQTESKFGMSKSAVMAMITRLAGMESVQFLGLHAHIGSQLFDIGPYQLLVKNMVALMAEIREKTDLNVSQLDLGGGFGVVYTDQDHPQPVPSVLSAMISELKAQLDQHKLPAPHIILEPGRSIVADAGVTLYSVNYTKQAGQVVYKVIDGGMGDNPRPITYGSMHTYSMADAESGAPAGPVRIVGRYCESGDQLGDATLPDGNLLVVYGTGAYNYSMASTYNRVPRPAMVMVKNGQAAVLVNRETVDDVLKLDESILNWTDVKPAS